MVLQKYTCDRETAVHRARQRVSFFLTEEDMLSYQCWEDWHHLVLAIVLGMAGDAKEIEIPRAQRMYDNK